MTATPRPRARRDDVNRPMIEDIRLLGRILGDVIREQEGPAAFELIERIRQLSVAYRLKSDAQAGRALDRQVLQQPVEQAVSVVRAFSYFSHLANLAEDRHHVRVREHGQLAGEEQHGTLASSFEKLARRGVRASEIAEMLQHAYLSPVLTAHPTEVQRKSVLDSERAVAELIGRRDGLRDEPERAENEVALRARVTQLWQPACCAPPS